MRIAFQQLALCSLLYLLPCFAGAQKDVKKYAEEAAAIRKEVWAWDKPEFNVRAIPAEYANASRVIIARHMEIISDSKKKTKFVGFGVAMYRELTLTEIVREAVKINDKSALADYSEISYMQLERRSGLFSDDKTTVYIGVKVIKPDGSVKEINTDDIVLTRNEKRDKEAKVAVPDLQPGDIIDFFLAKQSKMTTNLVLPSYTFTFFDVNPIMHYSVHCEIGSKYAVEYRCYNGAPDLKQTTGEDEGIVLDVAKKNITATTENNLWVSPYRQLPLIRMNIMLGYKEAVAGRNPRTPGKVYKNQSADEFIEDEMNSLSTEKYYLVAQKGSTLDEAANNYYKQIKKNRKNMSPDSLLAELFYTYRFDRLIDIYADTKIEDVVNKGTQSINSSAYAFRMGIFFKTADVDNQMVLTTSKYAPEMKNIMSKNDVEYMIMGEEGSRKIMGLTDIFSPAFYIPSYYENARQAITLDLGPLKEWKSKNFRKSFVNLPGSTADQNARIEHLVIKPDLAGSVLQIERSTTLKGHYKSDVQKKLILFEDYYESERKLLGKQKSLVEDFADGRKSKKYADELKTAFAQARAKQKDVFTEDIREWFEQDVTELKNYRIDNLGVRHNNPDFIYHSQFNMPGIIKKAGTNYIIEVGKLQGSPLKVEANQRKRTLDVYAPFARSLKYTITLEVPEGYTAEGVANLNKKVENVTGLFSCEAVVSGNIITLKVNKVYRNAFEEKGNWNNLVSFIDAANEWSNAKILLKKK